MPEQIAGRCTGAAALPDLYSGVVSGKCAAAEEFFARLKEHKLVQWTLGYVAVFFALIP